MRNDSIEFYFIDFTFSCSDCFSASRARRSFSFKENIATDLARLMRLCLTRDFFAANSAAKNYRIFLLIISIGVLLPIWFQLPLLSSSVGVFRGGEFGLENVSGFSAMCIHDGAAFGGSELTGVPVKSLLACRQS